MTTFLFKNNAISTLAGPISAVATTINVASGSGVLFPSPSGGQVFALTLVSASNPTALEIVYCTAVTGDTLTVVRGCEGTTAQPFLAGDFADHRLTAGALSTLVQSGNGFYYAQDTGTANSLVISVPAISALATGMLFLVEKGAAGVTGATQLTVNGSASFIIWADGSPLVNGDWPGVSPGLVAYDGTYFRLLTVMGPSVFQRRATAASVSTLTTASGQSISGNVFTTVQFPGTPTGFTNAGGVLTCTTAGEYSFSTTVLTSQALAGAISIGTFVEINWSGQASPIAQNSDTMYTPGAATTFAIVGTSNTIYVNAGDTVQIQTKIYNNGGGSAQTILTGSSFTISKVG